MITSSVKNILTGNILLIICCVFYLAWWIIAFKPEGAIKGVSSGWLLLPAAIAGIGAILVLVQAFRNIPVERSVISGLLLILIGVAAYFALLAVTYFCMHRMVTTELLLIVGWCILTLSEINVLYGINTLSLSGTIAWFIIVIVSAVISMICYVLYYGLDVVKGYIDGMIPLLIIAVVMLVITIGIIRR